MRQVLLATVAVIAASSAFAADVNRPPPAYKAPAVIAPADPFSGFYIGAHVGWGVNDGGGQAISAVPLSGVGVTTPQGIVGGIHAGYGQRFNSLLYLGLEGDVDVSAVNAGGNGFITATSKNDWMASIRGRAGIIPVGHALFYATGGWAWSGGQFSLSDPSGTNSVSPTMSGFVWGGGLEIPLSGNWLARVEYLRYDFGNATVNGPIATFSVNDRVEVVRGGLSYKF